MRGIRSKEARNKDKWRRGQEWCAKQEYQMKRRDQEMYEGALSPTLISPFPSPPLLSPVYSDHCVCQPRVLHYGLQVRDGLARAAGYEVCYVH